VIAAGSVRIPARRTSEVFSLHTIGDVHWGNSNCARDRVEADVERIAADPLARVLLMGDLGDYIGQADKRWDAATISPEVKAADLADWGMYIAKGIVKLLRPLRGKIVGSLEGNHESTFSARQAQQMHAWTCAELGVRNFGFSCFFDLTFERSGAGNSRRAYRIFAHHGAGAAQSPGGKINRLVSFMNFHEADVYLVGHVHEQDVKRIETLAASTKCDRLISRKKLGLFTGTYLRTYAEGFKANYSERAGYRPVPLGCSVVEFQPFGHDWVHREESVSAKVAI